MRDPRASGSPGADDDQADETEASPLFGAADEAPAAAGWLDADADTSASFMESAEAEAAAATGPFGDAGEPPPPPAPRRIETGRLGRSMLDDLFDRAKKIKG